MTQSYGTPIYMAPEVISSQPYDFKADIWSVGVTFFEMLCGSFPFSGVNKSEIFSRIRTGKYQFDTKNDVSPLCKDFISHCLQYDPTKRYSAAQLLDHPYLKYEMSDHHRLYKSLNKLTSSSTSDDTDDLQKLYSALDTCNHNLSVYQKSALCICHNKII